MSKLSSYQKGFTLIEVLIVVAILASLASIALQAYQNQIEKAANSACLAEVKSYANLVAVGFFVEGFDIPDLPDEQSSACTNYNISEVAVSIEATPKPPGGGQVICDMSGVAVCSHTQ